jgi:hypothetical protein
MMLQDFPYGGHYRARMIGGWPPENGAVPGWPGDEDQPEPLAQLDLFGGVA